ncbi:unnamed protein product, partial [Closterium sp. NIES-54]
PVPPLPNACSAAAPFSPPLLSLLFYARFLLPVCSPSSSYHSSPHFPHAVNGLTINVRKMFLEMDQPLYDECQRQFLEEEGRAADVEEVRAATWQRLEEAAGSNAHSQ